MKHQITPSHHNSFIINALILSIYFILTDASLIHSQPLDFCGAYPPHQATSQNPDSIYWDRFGNSYDFGYQSDGENESNRVSQTCGYFEIDYFRIPLNFRNTICEVFTDISSLIEQRINISSCGETIYPENVQIKINYETLDTGILGVATAHHIKPVNLGTCNEVFLDRIFKKINGGAKTNLVIDKYDGQISITNDSTINWHSSLESPPDGYYDLYSIILHEAGHLLGFASLLDESGSSEGGISNFDSHMHVCTEYIPGNMSTNIAPIWLSPCESNCWNLNDSIFSNFIDFETALLQNCSNAGLDFIFGQQGIAPIYGGDLERQNLSHLNPVCNQDTISYVMQRFLTSESPFNERRHFTDMEKSILCSLGYKIEGCDSCYIVSNEEKIEYTEDQSYERFFFGCINDTIEILFDELLCNDFTNGQSLEVSNGSTTSGIDLFMTDSSFILVGKALGSFAVYYTLSGCTCRALNAKFTYNIGPCFDCSSVDPCENLTCVNGFEQFPADIGSNIVQPELSDGPFWVYENTLSNSVDICADAEQNKYINIGGFNSNLEGLCLKLSEPVLPGCKVKINLDAAAELSPVGLRIQVSKYPPCNFKDSRISIDCVQTNCEGYPYNPICLDTVIILNAQTQNGNLCSPYPNLQPIGTLIRKNPIPDTINYIIFSPIIDSRSIRLDNIVVQQICTKPDFAFNFVENCNEVAFTVIDTNSANTHLWHFGDDSTSTIINPVHIYATSDTFLVTHFITDACGNSDSTQLNVIIDDQETECCPDTTISVSTTWDLTTILPGEGRFHTINVKRGSYLAIEDGLELAFCEGGALIIQDGAYVDLQGTLTSYGDMTWLGVFVGGDTAKGQHIDPHGNGFNGLQQGAIYAREGSKIENAKIGIRNYGIPGYQSAGGTIRCEGTTFLNNTIAVEFGPYQNINAYGKPVPSLGSFRSCQFAADSSYYLNEPFFGFVKMNKVDGMRFFGCNFKNNLLPELPSEIADFGFGIHSVSSGFDVYAIGTTITSPLCESPCVVTNTTTFAGLGHGIYVMTLDKVRPYNVYQSQFENCYRGITSVGSSGGTMLFNTFKMGEVPDADFSYGQIGVEFHFSHDGFTLQENEFVVEEETETVPIGVLCNGLGEFDNEIRRNTFVGIETANQAFGVNRDNNIFLPRGLVYLCNSFEETPSQGYDFHIPDTPADDLIHPFQTPGSISGSSVSTGNHFAYSAQDFMNYGEGGINYWYYPPGNNEEPRDSFSTNILKAQGLINQCNADYCAPPCIVVIGDMKEDFFNHHEDYELNLDNYINVLGSVNQLKIDSARSKALYYRRLSSNDAYTVVQHLMIDTLGFHRDSLISWMGHLDTYGAEVMIAGEYAADGDFESALDVLETISSRRDLSPTQSVDLEYVLDIYYLMQEKPLNSLSSSDRSLLRSIAYSNIGAASGVSRAVLSSFGEYIPLPYYHGDQINFRSAVLDSKDTSLFIAEQFPLRIYPNPSNSDITIEWKDPEKACTFLMVYDFFGQKVLELNGEYKSPFKLNTDDWKDGVHWIIAQDKEGFSNFGKVLIFSH